MNSCPSPGRRRFGFSLIEIVIALAVISFAIVGIMGLFPAAMKSAQESQRETRATLIARQILEDLNSLPGANTALVRGSSVAESGQRISGINLANSGEYILGFNAQGEGLVDSIAASAFSNAINISNITYVAKVGIFPDKPIPGITQIEVKVEVPAFAKATERSRYIYTTTLRPK